MLEQEKNLLLNGRLRTEWQGRKAESEKYELSDDDRTPRENYDVDLARQLRKCTVYTLPSLVYPVINSTKLAAFVVLGERGRGHAINDRTYVQRFCPLHALAAHGCSESDKFYGRQHLWYIQLL